MERLQGRGGFIAGQGWGPISLSVGFDAQFSHLFQEDL
jgi:hypothetical protein